MNELNGGKANNTAVRLFCSGFTELLLTDANDFFGNISQT